MECQYCNQILKTQGALKKHQNTAKYCLTKQNKNAPVEHTCCACDKTFTRKSSLEDHLKICKANIPSVNVLQEIIETIKKDLEISLLQIENLKVQNKKDLDAALLQIENLKVQNKKDLDAALLQILERDRQIDDYKEKMFILASKPTNHINNIGNNKTTNKTQNLIVSDWRSEIIQEKVEDNFKLEHVKDGLIGVARFTSQYITNGDGENKSYYCTDRNRDVFIYKDVDGVVHKDIQARKLKNAIKDPIIKKSSLLVLEERSRLSDIIVKEKDIDIVTLSSNTMNRLTDKFREIKNIEDNDTFTKEMAILSL
jgi:hypothetical protein